MTSHDRRNGRASAVAAAAAAVAALASVSVAPRAHARLADRHRVVSARTGGGHRDNGIPIHGPAYRAGRGKRGDAEDIKRKWRMEEEERKWAEGQGRDRVARNAADGTAAASASDGTDAFGWGAAEDGYFKDASVEDELRWLRGGSGSASSDAEGGATGADSSHRRLGSQLTGCCSTWSSYSAQNLCATYGQDCESGEQPSHDSGDGECAQDGLSFIGVSFSVNTANGNPYSYQLCDQFPMENIIDRDYNYIMSMDEDGWLVGGGYKQFDYSGKMPYIDSSHTELLRIGSMDVSMGGTSIEQVEEAMEDVYLPPLSIFPEYLKGGGGHHSGDNNNDDQVPSSDVTLAVSVVETYADGANYDEYSAFLDDLFGAMEAVGGGPCMDDEDTNPHVSMARGVKFHSSYHMSEYAYSANLEVAVWQAMYPKGTPIGSDGYASFPPGRGGQRQYVGYGNLYFFFDRANITSAFYPSRGLTDDEEYYATLYTTTDVSDFYASTTDVDFDYQGSGDGNDGEWEHNPYAWDASMAMHDMTDGWDLPPNCGQEGETFFGIPLSRKSGSKLQSTNTFQEQFDFEGLVDRNYTYIQSFGTNHGWLIGENIGNGAGSIVDRDTSHIPIFYTGTTNVDLGGISLSDLIRIAKKTEFGTLYIKPAFVFQDDNGHVKLQFEMDPNSALAYLYDNLCKQIGISWNYETPSNSYGVYTNCAMHAAGDRAKYGCGPDGEGSGGFCPQMTLGYSVRFQSEDHAAAYMDQANNYVDYWRSLYPSGVAVGTSKFCPDGGCLGLFLNRYDLYNVFKPDLGGSWVEYNGASLAPTFSPAPTWPGGCHEPHNYHLDKCFRKRTGHGPKLSAVAWDSLGAIGQFSVLLVCFMAITLSVSIFLARARKRKRKGESYIGFFFRDLNRKKKKKKLRRKKRMGVKELEEDMLGREGRRSRSRSSTGRTRSKSRSGHRTRSSSRLKEGGDGERSMRSRSRSKARSASRTRSSSRKHRGDGDAKSPRSQSSRRRGEGGGEKGGEGATRTQLV